MVLTAVNGTGDSWLLFATSIIPYLTVFGLCWKAIDKVFEYLGKRLKDVILDVVKSYVTPLMELMESRFDGFRAEHGEIKKLLEDIKKK